MGLHKQVREKISQAEIDLMINYYGITMQEINQAASGSDAPARLESTDNYQSIVNDYKSLKTAAVKSGGDKEIDLEETKEDFRIMNMRFDENLASVSAQKQLRQV